jgi:NADH-quinone oxidoreductase subunit D
MSAEPVLGYIHRMHEKMGENRGFAQFYPNTSRMDYVGAMTYNMGYAAAVEKLAGISAPERAQYIRVITCELNRIASHLLWFGAFLNDLGAVPPIVYAFDDREQILDLLEGVTGSRLTYNYFRFGGLYNDVDGAFIEGTRAFVKRMLGRLGLYETLVTKNVIFRNRVDGIGILSRDIAESLGCTGPVVRSTGIAHDVRKTEPYAAYESIDFNVVTKSAGDNLARYMVRFGELETSLGIISGPLTQCHPGPSAPRRFPGI